MRTSLAAWTLAAAVWPFQTQAMQQEFPSVVPGMTVTINHVEAELFQVKVVGNLDFSTGYVAFGVSGNENMVATYVAVGCAGCTDTTGNIRLQTTTDTYDLSAPSTDLSSLIEPSFTVNNKQVTMTFTTDNILGKRLLDTTTKYFLVAQGNLRNGKPEKHDRKSAVAFSFQTLVPTSTQNPSTINSPTPEPSPLEQPTPQPSRTPTSQPSKSVSEEEVGLRRIAILGGKGTFEWVVLPSSRRILRVDDLTVKAKLQLAVSDGSPPWVGIGLGDTMLGIPIILGFPIQGLGTFSGQSSRQVDEYVIEGMLRNDAKRTTTKTSTSRLQNASYTFENRIVTVSFQTSGIGSSAFSGKDSLTFAFGEGSEYGYHGHNFQTLSSVEWVSGSSSSDSSSALFAHGVLMVTAFLFLFPTGALTSSLRSIIPGLEHRWFVLHQFFQWVGFICVIIAFVLVFKRSTFELDDLHGSFGLALVGCLIIQVFFAYIFRKGDTRPVWRVSHFVIGFFIFFGGIFNCRNGLDRFSIVFSNEEQLSSLTTITTVGTILTAVVTASVVLGRCLQASNIAKDKNRTKSDSEDSVRQYGTMTLRS